MNIKLVPLGDRGAALLQVVLVGAILAIMAYMTGILMTNADRNNMRQIRRNQALDYAALLSDQVNEKALVKSTSVVPRRIGTGADIQYR